MIYIYIYVYIYVANDSFAFAEMSKSPRKHIGRSSCEHETRNPTQVAVLGGLRRQGSGAPHRCAAHISQRCTVVVATPLPCVRRPTCSTFAAASCQGSCTPQAVCCAPLAHPSTHAPLIWTPCGALLIFPTNSSSPQHCPIFRGLSLLTWHICATCCCVVVSTVIVVLPSVFVAAVCIYARAPFCRQAGWGHALRRSSMCRKPCSLGRIFHLIRPCLHARRASSL